MTRERTPWPLWLSAARGLGLAPATFWRLAMCEWRALAAPSASNILSRGEFDALAARYPDDMK
ncbi:MAG: phage tail assembly chaperone [Pseudomonadota bacterium]